MTDARLQFEYGSYSEAKAMLLEHEYDQTARHGDTERWVNGDVVALVTTTKEWAKFSENPPVKVNFY